MNRNIFETLLERAQNMVEGKNSERQIIAFRTAKGNICCFENMLGDTETEDIIFKAISKENDTEIAELVCLWDRVEHPTPGFGPPVDLPAYSFRIRLCELNEANLNTKILLRSDNGYNAVPLSVTIRR